MMQFWGHPPSKQTYQACQNLEPILSTCSRPKLLTTSFGASVPEHLRAPSKLYETSWGTAGRKCCDTLVVITDP